MAFSSPSGPGFQVDAIGILGRATGGKEHAALGLVPRHVDEIRVVLAKGKAWQLMRIKIVEGGDRRALVEIFDEKAARKVACGDEFQCSGGRVQRSGKSF